jgi:HlyD family secretion protein
MIVTRRRRRALAPLAPIALAAVTLSGCGGSDDGVLVASGTVEATDARLGFEIAGRIETIAVREGDSVAAGAELAALDRADAEARRAQAEARLAAAQARYRELSAGFRAEEVAQARAEVQAAQQRFADAERELERADRLFEGGAISREAHEKAALARDLAETQRRKAREQLKLVESGYRAEQVETARAEAAQAQAQLATADVALANTVLQAPFAGVVTLRHREPGEITAAGAPVLTVMNPEDRWVRIYVPEDRIAAVRLGRKAEIRCDTFPDRAYDGEVTFIAQEAEFTPRNVQTPDERVKLVYAVKVGVRGDGARDLKPGMPADVTLRLDAPETAP